MWPIRENLEARLVRKTRSASKILGGTEKPEIHLRNTLFGKYRVMFRPVMCVTSSKHVMLKENQFSLQTETSIDKVKEIELAQLCFDKYREVSTGLRVEKMKELARKIGAKKTHKKP